MSALDEDDTLGNQYLKQAKRKLNQNKNTNNVAMSEVRQQSTSTRVSTEVLKHQLQLQREELLLKQKTLPQDKSNPVEVVVLDEEQGEETLPDESNDNDNNNNNNNNNATNTQSVDDAIERLEKLIQINEDNSKVQAAQLEQFTKLLSRFNKLLETMDDARQQAELSSSIAAIRSRNAKLYPKRTSGANTTTSTRGRPSGRKNSSSNANIKYDFGYDNGAEEQGSESEEK